MNQYHRGLPIGKAINVEIKDGKLKFDIQYSNRFDEIMGRPMQQIDALCESAAKLKDRDFINDDNEISMKGDFDRCDECGAAMADPHIEYGQLVTICTGCGATYTS